MSPDARVSLPRRIFRLAKDAYNYGKFGNGQCRGIYGSVDEALAAIPAEYKSAPAHERLARDYQAQLNLLLDWSDFPLLFFLGRMLGPGATVLDIGGNVGIHYLRYAKYLADKSIDWVVLDRSEINKVGREVCAGKPGIRFIEDVSQLNGAPVDFLFGCGCFQYAGTPADFLRALAGSGGGLPGFALIDQLPVHEGPPYVTIQNVHGIVRYPFQVFNRAAFEQEMRDLGYEVLERWTNADMSCIVPFHRDKALRDSSGYLFSRAPR